MSSILLRNATILIHDEDDHVKAHYNTDLVVEGDTIARIGTSLDAPSGAQEFDCTGKIISPGFIDTHHHLWQTQLKGRHADESLFSYFPSAYLQAYSYTPFDTLWGQLSGCLEAIDAGTTFVLDHMHGAYTRDHAEQGLKASVASGLRMVYAHSSPIRLEKWDQEVCVRKMDGHPIPDWDFEFMEAKCKEQPFQGRVSIGYGFDMWFLPKEDVQRIFHHVRNLGVKVMTTHVGRNGVFQTFSPARMIKDYGLLDKYLVASHCNRLEEDETAILYDAGAYVSSTPETECQMGMGWPVALDEHVHGSLGIDCHANNSSSILIQARMLLQQIRQRDNLPILDRGEVPEKPTASTERAFNLATIDGARAVGMEDSIGSIKVGKKADLVIFDATESPSMLCSVEWDPMTAVLRHSDLRDIETVIIGGVVRKDRGRLRPVELDGKSVPYSEVVKKTLQSRSELQKRIDDTNWAKARAVIVDLWHVDESKIV